MSSWSLQLLWRKYRATAAVVPCYNRSKWIIEWSQFSTAKYHKTKVTSGSYVHPDSETYPPIRTLYSDYVSQSFVSNRTPIPRPPTPWFCTLVYAWVLATEDESEEKARFMAMFQEGVWWDDEKFSRLKRRKVREPEKKKWEQLLRFISWEKAFSWHAENPANFD